MKRLTATLLLTLAFVGINRPLQAQSDSPPPYLYYYSQLLGGLIIEHPDGTDSRQIAADVIPPNLTGLVGPGWSPSGKYFAAYGVDYSGYGGYNASAYLIDLNGHPVAPWLNNIDLTSSMQWSPPGEDILLVMGKVSPERYTDFGTFVWLIDVQHNKVLAEYGINVEMLVYSMSRIIWDTNHQQIVFYLKPDTYNVGDYYRVIMHFDGTILRELTTAEKFIALADAFNLEEDTGLYSGDSISPSGTYKMHGDHRPTLTDTRTGQTIALPRHTQSTMCRNYLWSKNEQFMITMDGSLIAGGGCGAAVMGITNPQGTLWRELGGCSWDDPPCVGWLPERVDVDALPNGSFKPIQLDPIKIEYDTGEPIYMIDPAKAHVLNFRCNQDSTADIRDDHTQKVIYQLTGTMCPYNLYNRLMPEEGVPVVVAEDPVHHLLVTYVYVQGVGVSVWILHNGHYEPMLKLNVQGLTLEFTDHGERLRVRNPNGWKIYAVADILAAASAKQ
jgi:hypothetical protein